MGFPLVSLVRDNNTITANQKRFLISPQNEADVFTPKSPYGYKWYVPLNCYTDKVPPLRIDVWMNMTSGNADDNFLRNSLARLFRMRVSDAFVAHLPEKN